MENIPTSNSINLRKMKVGSGATARPRELLLHFLPPCPSTHNEQRAQYKFGKSKNMFTGFALSRGNPTAESCLLAFKNERNVALQACVSRRSGELFGPEKPCFVYSVYDNNDKFLLILKLRNKIRS